MVASDLRHRVRADIEAMIQDISGIEAEQIDPEMNLFRLGLSSIALTQLRQRIHHLHDVEIPMASFYRENDTLEKLSVYVTENLPEKARGSLQSAQGGRAPAPPAPPTSERRQPETPAPSLDGSDPVKEIIQQQLHLMARQLDLLQGAAPAVQGASTRKEAPLEETVAAPPKPMDPRVRHEKVDLRSMTLIEDTLTPEQAEFVRSFTDEYSRRTQKSKAMMAAHRPVFSDWINSLGFRRSLKEIIYPVVARRSEDARIWDLDGNEYVDLAIGYGVNYFGNKPDFIVDAIAKQIQEGYQLGPQFDLTAEVAEQIRALTGVERVTFTNTGTEAVMTALRIARTATGRDKIVLFAGSYHGTFDGILAQDRNGESQPTAPGTTRNMIRDVIVLEYGAERSLEIIAARASELAAVLVEPVQSRNPSLQPRDFLHRLRAITAESKAALIFDEIITGFRLCPGGAQEHFGVRADLVTYGKVLGGGMPIGVIGGSARFMDAIDGGMWSFGDDSIPTKAVTFFGGTFCKHPLAMVAALAVLRRMADAGPALQREVNGRTARFAEIVNGFFEAERVPLRVRHCASFFRFESFGEYDAALQPITLDLLFYLLLSKGVYTWERRICFFSTAHTDADADRVAEAIKASVAELRASGFPFRDASPRALTGAKGESEPEGTRVTPMSSVQRRMFVLSQAPGGELALHLSVALKIDGSVDGARLERAFQEVVQRHESLRTGFELRGDDFVQVIHERCVAAIEVIDVSPDEIDATLKARVTAFDLARPPLSRISLIRAGGRSVFFCDAHHIATDGASVEVFVREFMAAYEGARLPPPDVQYRDYIAWLDRRGPELEAMAPFWLEHLSAPLPVLDLPTDFPRPQVRAHEACTVTLQIPASAVHALARERMTSTFMVLLAVYYAWLHRITGQEDFVVGTAVVTRDAVLHRNLVGMTTNTIALRARPSGSMRFSELLDAVRSACIEAFVNADYPFERLVERLGLARDASRSAVSDTLFAYEKTSGQAIELGGARASRVDLPKRAAQCDLDVDVVEQAGVLDVIFTFAASLFRPEAAERLARSFARLLDAATARPDERLSELALLTDADLTQLAAWNDTAAEYPQPRCLHEIFAEQARKTPLAVAVEHEGARLSYAELDAEANRLANHLRKLGVGPDVRVGLCIERSLSMMVGLLGILKAGGAYVPLDPSYPKERVAFMLEQARAPVLLSQQKLLSLLPSTHATTLAIDALALGAESPEPPSSGVTSENLAYVIFTSGSTGKPKGVMIPHRAIANRLLWMAATWPLGPHDAVLQKTPFSFDASVWELFVPLFCGARLVMARPDGHYDPAYLAQAVIDHNITVLQLVPSMLERVVHEPALSRCSSLVRLFAGGEALRHSLVELAWSRLPQVGLVNLYGPTEVSIDASSWTCEREARGTILEPIGRPIANIKAYVLDDAMRLSPIGVAGDLYVSGVGLARGYLDRPGLTADRFIPDPFSDVPGARMYRTGDRARLCASGELEFLGRVDHQVKIRGFRIELGEIEAALLSHPSVREAAVIAREDTPGEKRLVAYTAPNNGDVTTSALRDHLRKTLPDHMVPSAFVLLDAMPLAPNGKADKRALPAPEITRESAGTEYVTPRTEAEHALAEVWASVLRLPQVGVHDNFFALGGDSIKALLIVARMKERGHKLDVYGLFKHPTIAELSEQVTEVVARGEQGIVTGELPLTAVQARWLHHRGEPRDRFCLAVILSAREPLDPRALDQALRQLQIHHDGLRARFPSSGATVRPMIAGPEAVVALETVSLLGKNGDDAEAAFTAVARRVPAEVSLARGPLLKAAHVKLDHEDRLLLAIHHMVVDGVSWRVLLEDLVSAYNQALAGHAPKLPPKTASLKSWAERVHAYAQSDELGAEADAWRERSSLASAPLPQGRAKDGYLQKDRAVLRGSLDPKATEILTRAAPSVFGAGLQDVLLTALARALLARTTSDDRPAITIDLEGHGRTPPDVACFRDAGGVLDLSRTVGWFTTIYPFTATLPETNDLGEQIAHVRAALSAVPSGGFGYGVLRYVRGSGEPLFGEEPARVVFNYLGRFDAAESAGPFTHVRELTDGMIDPDMRLDYALEVEAQVHDDRLTWTFGYDAQAFDADTIAGFAGSFAESVRLAVRQCEERGGHLSPEPPAIDHALNPREWEALLAQGALDPKRVVAVYPLSPMQEGMLHSVLLRPTSAAYHEQFALRITGSLDPSRFEAAWRAISARHDVLRTVFLHKGLARPLQVVLRDGGAAFTFEDLSGESPSDRARRLHDLRADDLRRPFELSRGPLIRVYLQRFTDGDFRLVWSFHHILMDGWSTSILVRELLQIYGESARPGGAGLALPPAASYRRYIEWIERADWAPAQRYFRELLAGYDRTARLPKGASAPVDPGEAPFRSLVFEMSEATTERLRAAAAGHRVTLNSLLQSIWAVLLAHYNGVDDVVFGTVVSGRPAHLPSVEHMVGLFLNTLPLRVRPEGHQRVAALASDVQRGMLESEPYQSYALAEIQSQSPLRAALFDHVVVFENYPLSQELTALEEYDRLGIAVSEIQGFEQTDYDFHMEINPGARLSFKMNYSARAFSAAQIRAIWAHLERLMERVGEDPGVDVAALKDLLVSEEERREHERYQQSIMNVDDVIQ